MTEDLEAVLTNLSPEKKLELSEALIQAALEEKSRAESKTKSLGLNNTSKK
jgi:hypothetical protein